MIFIFDCNAHLYLINNPNYATICDTIAHQNHILAPYLSPLNFLELIHGIKSESQLISRKENLKKIHQLCGNALLPDPKVHIQQLAKAITYTDYCLEANKFIDSIAMFYSVKNLKEFGILFQPHLDFIREFQQKFIDSYKELCNSLLTQKKQFRISEGTQKGIFNLFKNYLNKPPEDRIYNSLLPNLLFRYEIIDKYNTIEMSTIFDQIPSLKYYIDVFWKYTSNNVLSGKTPRKPTVQDYFDLEQVVYLNNAHYLVTEEKRILNWVNNCGNTDLKGRAISASRFLELLNSPIITSVNVKQPAQFLYFPTTRRT